MDRAQYIPEIIQDNLDIFCEKGVDSLFYDGPEIQEKVLEDLMKLGCQSQYAKDHGFYGISTKQDFLDKVPISNYEDYLPYIIANMQNDDNQVSSLETDHYLLSTGRKQQGKYYIETTLGSLARQLSIRLWNMNLAQLATIMTQPGVKMMAITNCSPLENAPNGKAVRRTSGQAARELWENASNLYVFPYEFLAADMDDDDRDYLTALYALKEKHFNMLFCNNLGYFGVLLEWIEREPYKMIMDIMHGTMSVTLHEKDRKILSESFSPDPQRARELEKILNIYGYLPVEAVWPEFVFTGAWLAGSVGDYSKDVIRKLPASMKYLSESYGCSEGMLNIPLEYNKKYGPLAVYSCYFEFRLLGSEDVLPMSALEDGEYYEMIISTYSGLYRYNLNDIVRVRGYTGQTPNIEFCCRSSERVVLDGRVFYGFELSKFISRIEAQCSCEIDFYQMIDEDQKLSLILQFAQIEPDFMEISKRICYEADKEGISLNNIYWVKNHYRAHLYHMLMNNGRTIQCIKLPVIAEKAPDKKYIEAIYDAGE